MPDSLEPPQAELFANYIWPYLRSTARHRLPTRQLCAASVAPQRNRLSQVIPAERSQYFTAAGRQGASSARLIALAAVTERLKKSRHAAANSFITVSSPHSLRVGTVCLAAGEQKSESTAPSEFRVGPVIFCLTSAGYSARGTWNFYYARSN